MVLSPWYYPPVKIFPYVFIGVVIFYGIFGVIVRETFMYLSKFFKSIWINTISTALVLLFLMEGMNIFTKSWIYVPVHPIIFFLGWIILVLTFYIIPKKLNFFP